MGAALEEKKTYKRGKIRNQNREVILAAAREEFVSKGFSGASMQAIADRAGLPKANVHYYFKTKRNLYLAVLEEIMALWNDYFDEIYVEGDPAEQLDRLIRQKVELSYTHPKPSRLFAMEILQGAPHLRDYMSTHMRYWFRKKAAVIEAWVASGRMKPVDPTHLIFLIWSSTQHYADFETQVLTILDRKEYERQMIDQIADFLSSTILGGLGLALPRRSGAVESADEELVNL